MGLSYRRLEARDILGESPRPSVLIVLADDGSVPSANALAACLDDRGITVNVASPTGALRAGEGAFSRHIALDRAVLLRGVSYAGLALFPPQDVGLAEPLTLRRIVSNCQRLGRPLLHAGEPAPHWLDGAVPEGALVPHMPDKLEASESVREFIRRLKP